MRALCCTWTCLPACLQGAAQEAYQRFQAQGQTAAVIATTGEGGRQLTVAARLLALPLLTLLDLP
jgi:hypothetical protein